MNLKSAYISIVDDDTSGNGHRSLKEDLSDSGIYCL